jgi:hypothetical protein
MTRGNQSTFNYILPSEPWNPAEKNQVLQAIETLQSMHRHGLLGGAQMPEDAHPGLPPDSAINYHYFTLPMALNYQRNSYSLWKAATATFADPVTALVFSPLDVTTMSDEQLRSSLMKFKLALQPNSHCRIWRRISESIVKRLDGDIRRLFELTGSSVPKILNYLQEEHSKEFPYLCGKKICNYWLYVIGQYTDANLVNREALSIAPDTHVIQASVRLGLVAPDCQQAANAAVVVAEAWSDVLAGTGIAPIDLHTPLWLWSRGGFPPICRSTGAATTPAVTAQ